jgi:hypothetical protein
LTLRDVWDRQAAWRRYVGTPGHDALHEWLNFPAFLELLPPPPARTLDDGRSVRIEDYFSDRTKVWTDERDGIAMEFHDRVIPLERYARALEDAGLLVERLREVASVRRLIPIVLQLRAVKP